jgi:hypothetical protein
MEQLPFVYLTSAPFSGSTLFSILAASHPSIVTVGEMSGIINSEDPNSYVCSCGTAIKVCPFWINVTSRMRELGFDFSPLSFDTAISLGNGPLSSRILNSSLGNTTLEDIRDAIAEVVPAQRQRLRYLIDRNKSLARAILDVSGRSQFFDASKTASVIRHMSRERDLDFRAVHLVRDARGIAWSRRNHKGEINWRVSVDKWIRTNSNIERQLSRLSIDRWIRIRYEELCEFPVKTMNRFFSFCGLPPFDVASHICPAEHHIVGNKMRLARVSDIRVDDSWRHALSADVQMAISKRVKSMHDRYGYTTAATRSTLTSK